MDVSRRGTIRRKHDCRALIGTPLTLSIAPLKHAHHSIESLPVTLEDKVSRGSIDPRPAGHTKVECSCFPITSQEDVSIVEHRQLQDGSREPWPAGVVASYVRDFVEKRGVNTVRPSGNASRHIQRPPLSVDLSLVCIRTTGEPGTSDQHRWSTAPTTDESDFFEVLVGLRHV